MNVKAKYNFKDIQAFPYKFTANNVVFLIQSPGLTQIKTHKKSKSRYSIILKVRETLQEHLL